MHLANCLRFCVFKACSWVVSRRCCAQAHCRRLATGHLPAAAQGVSLDADPVIESGAKEAAKGPAAGRPGQPGNVGPAHSAAPAAPYRGLNASVNRLAVRAIC